MIRKISISITTALFFMAFVPASFAQCLTVKDNGKIKISRDNIVALGEIGLDRADAFAILKEIASHETNGCWAGPTGNFDDQVVSVGAMQWNFGKGSLQPLLKTFKSAWGKQFPDVRNRLMPEYGRLIFSSGCLRRTITADCSEQLIAAQTNNNLNDTIKNELIALFESDTMLQKQMDRALKIITSVRQSLRTAFSLVNEPTPLQVYWMIDVHVQRGSMFSKNGITKISDVRRVRDKLSSLSKSEQMESLRAVVKWYEGQCNSLDSAGTRYDCDYNVREWNRLIDQGTLSAERVDLVHLSMLKDRTAVTKSGYYQGDAFQRRATIAFGVGSVHGRKK